MHFKTVGILSILWILGQALFGGATVWFDGALLGGGMKAKRFWKYHRLGTTHLCTFFSLDQCPLLGSQDTLFILCLSIPYGWEVPSPTSPLRTRTLLRELLPTLSPH